MPQDGLRSAIYRSFVTCDDPKGVVNCRTITKSKTDSQKMDHHKRESRRKLKSLSTTSLGYEPEVEEIMASKGIIPEEIHSPASFQLMEVSRGAENLNHVIESWSKGMRFDRQSEDVAKDLLKGALDLQDSLVMLGKLQEASQYMAHLKKKHMEKSERGREDEPWIGRTSSEHFRDKFSMTGYQKPRLSVDGSSRNSTEELKKVIRESLVSQNLLPKARKHHERAYCFPQRNLDSASTSESPSTTSCTSQSSLARLNADSPTASASVAPQTTKGPNLIAKLMGLEECPLKPLQATPQNQFEGQKTPNQLGPFIDIEKPKVKKSQYGAQKVSPERTLKKVLESMQFKGLLRSNSAKGPQPCSDDLNVSQSKQRLVDAGPPIVLIKPLRVPSLEPKETNRSVFEEEDPLYRRKMLRKLRRKEEPHPKGLNFREGNSNSDKVRRRPEAKETTSQGLKQEAAKEKRVVVELPLEKEVVVVKENALVKSKASLPVNQKQQRNEAIEKRAEKVQKVITVNRKSLEKHIAKTKSVPKSEAKKILIKAVKPESESNIPKSQISQQPSTKPSSIKNAEHGAACNSIYQKKNRIKKDKPLKEPTAAKTSETSVREEDEKKIEYSSESDSHGVTTGTNLENQLPELVDQTHKEEVLDGSGSQIRELCRERQNSLFEITRPTPSANHETDSEKQEEELKNIDLCNNTDGKSFKSEARLRDLLLGSPSFQSCAEEFFDLNTSCSSIIQTSCIDDFGASSLRLSLDCATEIIECISIPDSQTFHPLLPTCIGKSKRSISIEMLVEEVIEGIETLTNYSKLADGDLLVDCLYVMLERDLMCKGVVNQIWDSGWRSGFSLDKAEQVVNDIEKLVLTGLIEEVFA